MALNIKSADAYRLAKQLATARGSTLTEAVTSALSESLRSEKDAKAGVEAMLEEVRQVQALVASLPDGDARTPEEILYDQRGLPR